MQPVLNVEDIKNIEHELELSGVSTAELMRRAGHEVAAEVVNFDDISKVVVLCGTGNNAGDGWVCAEILKRSGVEVLVVTPLTPEQLKTPLANMAARSAITAGVHFELAPDKQSLEAILSDASVVVDAMLGTGIKGSVEAPYNIWIDTLNSCAAHVIAVDVPSGLGAQTGDARGPYVIADETVTMIALKAGLFAGYGRDACGQVIISPLAKQTESLVEKIDAMAYRLDSVDYIDCVDDLPLNVDKYSRGSVLVVAGSLSYPGAAIMAAKAAARSGAGYVTLAVPQCIATVCRTHLTEIPVVGMMANEKGTFSKTAVDDILALAKKHTSVVCGCGMEQNSDVEHIVSALIGADVPLVLDADALNALAHLAASDLDKYPELTRREAPLILTPNAYELGRLVDKGINTPSNIAAQIDAANKIVWSDGGSNLVVVSKGSATACVSSDIALLPRPTTFSQSTAGTGDVLAGVIGSFLSRGKIDNADLPLKCAYACEIGTLAARAAEDTFGARGVMALDIIESLSVAEEAFEQQLLFDASGVDEDDLEEENDEADEHVSDDASEEKKIAESDKKQKKSRFSRKKRG